MNLDPGKSQVLVFNVPFIYPVYIMQFWTKIDIKCVISLHIWSDPSSSKEMTDSKDIQILADWATCTFEMRVFWEMLMLLLEKQSFGLAQAIHRRQNEVKWKVNEILTLD